MVSQIKRYLYQNPPNSATRQGWNEWRQQAKKNKIRWFIFNTFPLWIKSTFIWPIERGMDWIRYRVKNYTKIQIHSLKPGYYENDTLLLHGMFQLLVDFVELEKASRQYFSIEQDKMSFRKKIFSKFKRSRELGIKYLDWEISLIEESRNQAEAAKEQKELYLWWKDIYPKRPDPMDIKGQLGYSWSDYCELIKQRYPDEFFPDTKTPEEENISDSANKASQECEEKYEKEDEEMLIRLVKIRSCLWT